MVSSIRPAAIGAKRVRVRVQVKPITTAALPSVASAEGMRSAPSLAPNARMQSVISQISNGGLVFHRSGRKP